LAERGQGWQGSKTQAYWLVVRVLLTPPAEAAASQKWKIIYLQVLRQVDENIKAILLYLLSPSLRFICSGNVGFNPARVTLFIRSIGRN
jgi:hypothetical protein